MTGREFRDLRVRAHMRMDDVARLQGVDVFTVHEWESDKAAIPEDAIDALIHIASAIGAAKV